MHPWHMKRHRQIVASLVRRYQLGQRDEDEVNASHARGCAEYGQWNHHKPGFDHPAEIAAELVDALGLAGFEIEELETGELAICEDEREAFSDLLDATTAALAAARRMQAARERVAQGG